MASNNVLKAPVLTQTGRPNLPVCVGRGGGCPFCGDGGRSCLLSGPLADVGGGGGGGMDEVVSQPMFFFFLRNPFLIAVPSRF